MTEIAFQKVWRDHHVTWSVDERLRLLCRGLAVQPPEKVRAALVRSLGEMEAELPPDLVADAAPVLQRLSRQFKLCIISDTVYTPGVNLRRILRHYGIASYFQATIFSDEIGRSKPHHRIFEAAARALEVAPSEMIHVGDRQHNDVAGAQAIGMKAILFVGSRDTDRAGTTADAVCRTYAELELAIQTLAT